MPPRTAASRQRQASSANFIGGTTKQLDCETNGRARQILLAAGDVMQHLQALRRHVRAHHAGADMLGRAGKAGIERVDIEIMAGEHVARHDRPLEEMDVVAAVDDARRSHRGRPAATRGSCAFRRLDDMDRRTRRAEMTLLPWLACRAWDRGHAA